MEKLMTFKANIIFLVSIMVLSFLGRVHLHQSGHDEWVYFLGMVTSGSFLAIVIRIYFDIVSKACKCKPNTK